MNWNPDHVEAKIKLTIAVSFCVTESSRCWNDSNRVSSVIGCSRHTRNYDTVPNREVMRVASC